MHAGGTIWDAVAYSSLRRSLMRNSNKPNQGFIHTGNKVHKLCQADLKIYGFSTCSFCSALTCPFALCNLRHFREDNHQNFPLQHPLPGGSSNACVEWHVQGLVSSCHAYALNCVPSVKADGGGHTWDHNTVLKLPFTVQTHAPSGYSAKNWDYF